MSPAFAIGIVFILLGLGVALLNPLGPVADRYGPGMGDVLNGGAGLVLLLLGGITAAIAAMRRRKPR